MNYRTTVALALPQYYAFVSDLASFAPASLETTAEALARVLSFLVNVHPDAYRELSLSERRRLRVSKKDQAWLDIGESSIDELSTLARVERRETSLVAGALMEDCLLLDCHKKKELLNPEKA